MLLCFDVKDGSCIVLFSVFFFNDTATTEIYTLSLHDALPIFPEEWWWDPKDNQCVHGMVPDCRLKEVISNMIDRFGIDSLQLKDKPKLKDAFFDFAYSETENNEQ